MIKNKDKQKISYAEKLRDPRWQKKRLQIMERDEFTCQLCGDKKTTLNVHHKKYSYGKEPWEYDDANFVTLCEHCHHEINLEFNFDDHRIMKITMTHGKRIMLICEGAPFFYLKIYDEDNENQFSFEFDDHYTVSISSFIQECINSMPF